MNALLLLAVFAADPRVIECYVQDQCLPCRADEAANGIGNKNILIVYLTPVTFPPQVTGTPAYHDVKTGRWAIGRRSIAQLEEWVGIVAARPPPAVKPKQWRQVERVYQRGRRQWKQWEWVFD